MGAGAALSSCKTKIPTTPTLFYNHQGKSGPLPGRDGGGVGGGRAGWQGHAAAVGRDAWGAGSIRALTGPEAVPGVRDLSLRR